VARQGFENLMRGFVSPLDGSRRRNGFLIRDSASKKCSCANADATAEAWKAHHERKGRDPPDGRDPNCDQETAYALKLAGAQPDVLHINRSSTGSAVWTISRS